MTVCFEDTPAIYIKTDKELVTRIINNLIRNCFQHSNGDIKVQLSPGNEPLISFQNTAGVGGLSSFFFTYIKLIL